VVMPLRRIPLDGPRSGEVGVYHRTRCSMQVQPRRVAGQRVHPPRNAAFSLEGRSDGEGSRCGRALQVAFKSAICRPHSRRTRRLPARRRAGHPCGLARRAAQLTSSEQPSLPGMGLTLASCVVSLASWFGDTVEIPFMRRLLLPSVTTASVRTRQSYASPWWVTFNQARALRGTIRRGERATHVVCWHPAFDLEEPPQPLGEAPRSGADARLRAALPLRLQHGPVRPARRQDSLSSPPTVPADRASRAHQRRHVLTRATDAG
jgi:hypothetical protein